MKRIKRGFTLIELLVVILILAILAAMIVPRVMGRASDAKRVKARTDVTELKKSLTHYHLDNDAYPSTEDGLGALRTQPSDAKNWRGPYTEDDIPLDPWGNEYIYESPGPNGDDSFQITCLGADGKEGGEAQTDGEDIIVTGN